jgi:HEAT repeat protein
MIALSEFQRYLQKICCRYEQWWAVDALTETIADQQATFSFEQMVQTEEKKPGEKPQIVSLSILKGIQNYVESEHILLVGSPGVGKSTALLRCLVSFAKEELGKPEPRIPVLVPLKRYNVRFSSSEDPSGMLTLIRDALKPQLRLKIPEVEELLFQKRLILLLDGLNEMPADTVRTQLKAFREECDEVPLICTTRELGSGDLGIKRRLEVQPPSPPEIKRFLRECMPGQAQQVLQLLSRDNRELSRTPFVLWMLYHLLQETGAVVETLGEAFRQFFRSFKKYKEDAPVIDERRKAWNLWLEHLAFTMLNSPEPTDPGLVISDDRAEKALAERFGELHGASSRIEELLKYHLLERVSEKEVSFPHQLIQEYYAAEYLLQYLPELLRDEEGETKLKCHYLNYLKWTEPLALMLALVEDEEQAVGVVRLALEVDLMLGSRFAGEVNSRFHKQTVRLVKVLRLPINIKIQLLGITRSDEIVNLLRKKLADKDIGIRWTVVEALGNVKNEAAVMLLIEALNDSDSRIRYKVVAELGGTNSEAAVIALINVLKNDESPDVRWRVIASLGKIGSESAVIALIEALQDCYSSRIRAKALLELRKLGEEVPIEKILNLLEDSDAALRLKAAYEIEYMKNSSEIKALIEERGVDIFPVLTPEEHMSSTSEQVARLVNDFREIDTTPLIDLLNHDNWEVCCGAATALGELRDESAISALSQVLNDEDQCIVWSNAATALGKIGTKAALLALVDCLKTENSELRRYVIDALGETRNNLLIEKLALRLRIDDDQDVRCSAAIALGKIGGNLAVKALIEKILLGETPMVERIAAEQLGKIAGCEKISYLWSLIYLSENTAFLETIKTIQSRYQFYNYEIYQQAQEAENLGFEDNSIKNFYEDLDKVISQIQENPELRQSDKEDRLTIDIVNQLRILGYEASHDSKIGGHVDIVVRKSDFLWLGEAKKYNDNNSLWQGFRQLTTRYSIGDSNQENGGLLIYIFDEDASLIMEKWQNYLLEKRLPNYSFRPCKMRRLAFISTHRHERSGQAFHVRHIPVMLHFAPKDKSARRRKKSP